MFLATDSLLTLSNVRRKAKVQNLYSFSQHFSTDGNGLHLFTNAEDRLVINQKNREAILDLLTLAYAKRVIAAPVVSLKGQKIKQLMSGFSVLAHNLNQAKVVLHSFTGITDHFSLNHPAY